VISEYFGEPWFGSTAKPTQNTNVCSPKLVAVYWGAVCPG